MDVCREFYEFQETRGEIRFIGMDNQPVKEKMRKKWLGEFLRGLKNVRG